MRGGWVQGILGQCEHPEQVFQNWMDRDVAFARWVSQEATRLGLRVLRVDGRRTVRGNAEVVQAHFRLQ
jgi:hypothetical protein